MKIPRMGQSVRARSPGAWLHSGQSGADAVESGDEAVTHLYSAWSMLHGVSHLNTTEMTTRAFSPALPYKLRLFLCSLAQERKPMTNQSLTMRMWKLRLTLLCRIVAAWTG